MPISDRGTSAAKPYTADYIDAAGKRRQNIHATRLDAEIDIIENAGPASIDDLATEISVEALFTAVERVGEGRYLCALTLPVQKSRNRRLVLSKIGSKRIARVTKSDFNALLSVWKRDMVPQSLGNLCTFVTSAFDFAVYRNCVPRNLARVAFQDINRTFEHLPSAADVSDVDLIRANVEGWLSVQFALYVEAGLTAPEAAALEWSSIDFERMQIHVSATVKRARDISPLDRRRKTRSAPMSQRLAETLFAWRLDPRCAPRYVIGGPDGKVRARHTLLQMLCKKQVELGIVARSDQKSSAWTTYEGGSPRYMTRNFRHYAALQWHAQGVGLKEIARRLGHKNGDTVVALLKGQPNSEDIKLMASVDLAINLIIKNNDRGPEEREN